MPLSRGLVFIQYRTENLRVVPVFGKDVADISTHEESEAVQLLLWAYEAESTVRYLGVDDALEMAEQTEV